MKTTKKTLIRKLTAAVLAGCLAASLPATAGGIPTYDSAAVFKAAEQAVKLGKQIENQIKQIKELKAQVKALTGSRNIGKLLRNEAQEALPDEWKAVYEAAKKQGGSNVKDLLSGKGYNAKSSDERLVKQFDMTLKSIKDSQLRMDNIRSLIDEIDKTQDAKAAADLQNRIAGEQAKIQQNQINLDTMARLYEMQKEIDERNFAQHNKCARAKKYGWKEEGC